MSITISNSNIKGGIGKTIGNCTMAEILGKCGYKTLLIDNDPQANATLIYNMVMPDQEHYTIKDLYMCPEDEIKEKAMKMVYPTAYENIDMIVSEPAHKETGLYLLQQTERDARTVLANAIKPLKEQYDFIIIDKNPSEDILATNVFAACDQIISPVEMDGFSYQGLSNLFMEIEDIRSYSELNPDLNFRGIYMVKTVRRSTLFRRVYEAYQQELGDMFLLSNVRSALIVHNCSHYCKPLLHMKKRTNPGEDYILLMYELGYITEEDATKLLLQHAVSKEYR